MRSASRSAASRQAHGPSTSRSAIATVLDSKAVPRPFDVAFWSTNDDHSDGDERETDHDRAPLRPRASRIPAPHERGRPDQRVGEPEAAERDRARDRESRVAEQPPARRWGRAALRREREPGAAVRSDPGAARESEQREREPDERGVDSQALGDPGADARERTLALRAPEAREGERQPVRRRAQPRRTSMLPIPTSASTFEHRRVRRRPGDAERPVRVDAVVAPAEDVDLADSGVGVDLERDVPRAL